jgi:hypothetical protein
MPAVIISKPVEILNELEKIGLTGEQVLEIVHAMAGAKADATENDPPGAAGWSAWRMGVRRARAKSPSMTNVAQIGSATRPVRLARLSIGWSASGY